MQQSLGTGALFLSYVFVGYILLLLLLLHEEYAINPPGPT
jgi:hypothetical protein